MDEISRGMLSAAISATGTSAAMNPGKFNGFSTPSVDDVVEELRADDIAVTNGGYGVDISKGGWWTLKPHLFDATIKAIIRAGKKTTPLVEITGESPWKR